MTRTEEFIELYNQLSHRLGELSGRPNRAAFYELIDACSEKDAIIRKQAKKLKDYGDLRNAIVHSSGYPREAIAEVTEQTLSRFKRLVEYACKPPLVGTEYRKDVETFSEAASLKDALICMRENDYSQIVVISESETISLLTGIGISRWLYHQIPDDVLIISETQLSEVVEYEPKGTFEIVHANMHVGQAEARFQQPLSADHPDRLQSLIITNDGKSNSPPVGIITPWDLLSL